MADNDRYRAYWKKCRENLYISDIAKGKGKINVAASRYYYALRFAAGAFFDKKGFDDIIDERLFQPDFVIKASNELAKICPPQTDVETWFQEALNLRTTGDYKDYPVLKMKLDLVIDELDVLFSKVEGELSGS